MAGIQILKFFSVLKKFKIQLFQKSRSPSIIFIFQKICKIKKII